ncbi:MAG TPA: hypothetical protein VHV83_18020 [Armatimonadota bacterium]|nr:hypothetical protein [Armatimonadota bacterium]
MDISQQCDVSYHLDGETHHGSMNIEKKTDDHGDMYRAVIETSPLHGTYGGFADNVDLALDFLNLAMQAEGADEIVFTCHKVEQ